MEDQNTSAESEKYLTAKEVAKIMRLDIKTVRRNYIDLGGIKVGSRYRFFENLIREKAKGTLKDAVQEDNSEQKEVAGNSSTNSGGREQKKTRPNIRHKGRSARMGGRCAKNSASRVVSGAEPSLHDPYGILNRLRVGH